MPVKAEALTACTDLSHFICEVTGVYRIKQLSSAQCEALTFPVSQPLARLVAASSHPFILFMHKERVVGKTMQPEPHPVPLNV